MSRLTSFVLRHRLLVVVSWLVLAVAGGATASTTADRLSQGFSLPSSPAQLTAEKINNLYGTDAGADPVAVVVTLAAGQSVDTPGVRDRLGQAFAAVRQTGARVVDYPSTGDHALMTRDGRTAYALIFPPPNDSGEYTAEDAGPLAAAVRTAAPGAWTVRTTGIGPLHSSGGQPEGNGVLAETLIGGIGALVVLAFVFASLVAVLPLLMAAVSILTAFLLLLGLTVPVEVNFVAQFIVGLIGLGVAIDYALLVVTRWREERSRGADNRAAVVAAMEHAGRAVVFSGLTVAVGLLALAMLPLPAMRSFGYAGALIPLVSVAVAVTLLPVLLDTIGPRLDTPRLRDERTASRAWTWWARGVVRRRWVAALAGLVALVALAAPVTHLHLGEARSTALASSGEARDGLTALTRGGVPSGVLTPVVVLVDEDAARAVSAKLRGVSGVVTAIAPETSDHRQDGTALVTVLPAAETGYGAGQDIVRRNETAVAGDRAVIGVTGSGATGVDVEHASYSRFPLMLGVVCLLTFVLLARAFRSLVLPAKAVLLNLVSLGAAYGVLVLLWQDGHGSTAIWDTASTGAIPTWIPLIVFAFLFGLSMDYEVFLLARMREAYDGGADTDAAVVTGLSRTGRLVTCAALVLVLAFVSMSTAPVTEVRMLATGLGAGILIDATLVRCLLVPTLVSLFGRWNWWLPRWAAAALRVSTPGAGHPTGSANAPAQ